jgi:hypothetical protein
MDSLKKHGDPLEDVSRRSAEGAKSEEIRQQPARGVDEVADNEPGSKGRRDEEDQPIVRSAGQTPNPNQSDEEATMEPGGDLGHKRNTM